MRIGSQVPCDPKMLVAPLQPDKLSRFFVTTIEKDMRKEPLLAPDLGVHISLLDIGRFDVPDVKPPMDPADAALLEVCVLDCCCSL